MPIEVRDVSYIYMPGTPYETKALDGVTLSIRDGERLAIVGHTGSGKSTLVQHFNGLLIPTEGEVTVNGISTRDKSKLKEIRREVGMVFQYPEHQLFEETVYKDIAFGPRNLGFAEEEIEERVRHAMERMELDFEKLKDRSPFELSGGQQRRVAIAGVLAMNPGILILDEPAAGLDPSGKQRMRELLLSLHTEGITILFITHNMEEVAEIAQRVVVMNRGRVYMDDTPDHIFAREADLREVGLGVPAMTTLVSLLNQGGFSLPMGAYTVERAFAAIRGQLGGGGDAA
jgi:energy-coupling factor transport system ATP-binding protein